MIRRILATVACVLALAFLGVGVGEAIVQHAEDEYVRRVTQDVLRNAPDNDLDSKVTAIRDYLRVHVRDLDFYADRRPFLRDTAAETLRMGKGRCGEATRVFINMARAAGIPAQRLYLEGVKAHVVALIDGADGKRTIVDSADNPFFADNEPLSNLPQHVGFTSSSSVEWRRLRFLRRLPVKELRLGPLVYFLENPHALVACVCFVFSAAALLLAAALRSRLPHAPVQRSNFTGQTALTDGVVEV
ncbi:MAG TPA: transglutaminase-like domain-containing protein [Pyrinomonadaceae bacterium]|nr:transglutaminase-like domain-containing protein [Pyrinomonadaceae bacterium]